MFTELDIKQIQEKGLSMERIQQQISYFENGFPYLDIVCAATPQNGIITPNPDEQRIAVLEYENYKGEICKFVPASGAATRMFKDLYEALRVLESGEEIADDSPAAFFFDNLERFSFYEELVPKRSFSKDDKVAILRTLLYSEGLGYGSLPKGLIKFHNYKNYQRTPFEEHLFEAAKYSRSSDGKARVVVTVSPEHLNGFEELLNRVRSDYQRRYNCEYEISFTLQKESTDTLAVDMDNKPFRDNMGRLVFRPGGHGALIENLNEIDSDIVVIKNIDNVTREELTQDTIWWKKVLIGTLLSLRCKLFGYIRALEEECSDSVVCEIREFLESSFSITLPNLPEPIVKDYLMAKLNRPLRVCGMVKNTGEPGGGPFIVRDSDGSTSLQILESAQLNTGLLPVRNIVESSTHFNPVDIVCSFRDYKGEKFDLNRFIDNETGFISNKSTEGRSLKALELPGLWNGAMSQWNTAFIEVPVSTFSPVKSILDLLRSEHTV
ncbi:MAG: DUF4301 family protein [Bacteroidales bacterium]|nr:DUF4301 family protein [Bacteroidales bacterium]